MIRTANLLDVPAVAHLEAMCFPAAEAASSETLCQRIQTFPECFLVLQQDGDIVAMINGCVSDHDTICDALYEDVTTHQPHGAYQSVFGLDVHPKHWHKGLARQMMLAFIKQAQDAGRKGMILTCKQHLITFYESFGYQNMGMSKSSHGGAIWYDMRLEFGEMKKND